MNTNSLMGFGCPCQEGMMGLGDGGRAAAVVSSGAAKASKAIASGSAAAAGVLTTIGFSAQAVPVIGTVLGAVALVAGALAKLFSARKEAKALYAQKSQYENALKVMKQAHVDADAAGAQLNAQIANIQSQLKATGLGELGSFGSWLKKTFTPRKYAQQQLNETVKAYNAQYPELEASLNQKIAALQNMEVELKNLQSSLETAKTAKQAGGIALAVFVLLVGGGMLLKKFKNSKAKKAE